MSGAVYIVTDGSYSDYHTVAVFSTRAKAQACIAAMKRALDAFGADETAKTPYIAYDDPRVEEYELDPGNEQATLYCVSIDPDGTERHRYEAQRYPWQTDLERTHSLGRMGAFGVSPRGYDVALKAARDVLYEWKAQQEGLA